MNLYYKHTKDIVLISMLSIVLFVSQIALSFIINVNVVSLLLVVYVINLGFKRTMYILVTHIVLLGLYFGFSYWLLGYLWIYPILLITTKLIYSLFGKNTVLLAMNGAIFGLIFGFLFAVHDSVFLGVLLIPHYFRGLPSDIVHASSNLIGILLCFDILDQIFKERNHSQMTKLP